MTDDDQVSLLAARRRERKLSQDAVASEAGIALKTYQNLELGKIRRPHKNTLKKVASVLELDPRALERELARQKQNATLLEGEPYGFQAIAGFEEEEGPGYVIPPHEAQVATPETPAAENVASPGVEGEQANGAGGPRLPADLLKYYRDYCQCEEIFRTLARQNAHCDVDIFDDIYKELRALDFATEWKTRKARVSAAKKSIKANLAELLDAMRRLFKILHGGEFSVCIQFLKQIERDGVRLRTVETLMRDPVSAAAIERSDADNTEFHAIEANTISHEIYNLKKDFVHYDNLREKIRERQIETTSKNAGLRYNAVIVKRLHRFGPNASNAITSLCVDAPASAFNGERVPVSMHFVSEIGWRVSAMLYRLEILEEDFQLLPQR